MFTGRDANVTDEDRRRSPLHALPTWLDDLQHADARRPMGAYARLVPDVGVQRRREFVRSPQSDCLRRKHVRRRSPEPGDFQSFARESAHACMSSRLPRSSTWSNCWRTWCSITDHGQGSAWIKARLPLAVLRNFDAKRAPGGFGPADLARLFEQFLPRFRSDAADWGAKDNTDPEWRLADGRRHVVPGSLQLRFRRDRNGPGESRNGLEERSRSALTIPPAGGRYSNRFTRLCRSPNGTRRTADIGSTRTEPSCRFSSWPPNAIRRLLRGRKPACRQRPRSSGGNA